MVDGEKKAVKAPSWIDERFQIEAEMNVGEQDFFTVVIADDEMILPPLYAD